MQDQFDLDFCFKGDRTYVHGTDIFNKLTAVLVDSGITNSSIDFSIHGISRANITVLNDKPADVKTIKFALKYFDENNLKKQFFGIENENRIECRYAYPEERILETIQLNADAGEIKLNEDTSYTFIENILVLNKHLILTMFPNLTGKWYFTKLELKKMIAGDFYPLKLIFRRKFNFKLTKTEIFIGEDSVGFLYFSLV